MAIDYADVDYSALDEGWVIVAGCLVFFMHAGFSLLEAGSVQRKNTQSILAKNLTALCAGALAWHTCGYGFAYGEDSRNAEKGGGFMGVSKFWTDESVMASWTDNGQKNTTRTASSHYDWWFQFTFCATAATIVSGAIAERASIVGFAIFSTIMTGFIYPIVVHWCWSTPGGLLKYEGYQDLAGSGIVHMTGGFAALAGAQVIGPRQGAYDGEPLKPTSMLLVTFGTLILFFGWFGFNAGSTLQLSAGYDVSAARCMICTTISGSVSGITLFFIESYRTGVYNVSAWCNGILAGLVAITAGCDVIDPAIAILVGAVAAMACDIGLRALDKLEIDDVIGAFPVHGVAGAWGVLATALFDMNKGMCYGGQFESATGPSGTGGGGIMRANLMGICLIAAWAYGISYIVFKNLMMSGVLRVSEEVEAAGLDTEFVYKNHCGQLDEE